MPIHANPSISAASAVVPEPRKGSKTTPPRGARAVSGYRVVAAQMTQEGIEIRCSLCGDFWPATGEFYRDTLARCRACSFEVQRIKNTPKISRQTLLETYANLKALRSTYPLQGAPAELCLAVRRAYWRERKRAARAAA